MINRVFDYQNKTKRKIIIGSGWDQSLWEDSAMPDNRRLNEEFPNTPVCLYRIDGHSALVNRAFIDLLGDFDRDIKGGEVSLDNGEPNGMFIDAALSILEPLYSCIFLCGN